MATYDKRIKIGFNRLLDRTALRENWLEFFDGKLAETVSAMFQGKSGTLDAQKITLASTVNDTFDLDMTNARKVVVGSGNVITLPLNASRVLKEHLQVPFENTSGQTYEVGIRYQQVEDGIQINGRTGAPEYPRLREDMGELGNPDSVTDTPGVSITLRVNGLTQSSIDHSGRKVIVFMTTPVSGVESTAFYEGSLVYNSPNNEVVIPYSGGNGPLGQDTSVNPPSTLATDYKVFLPGASWKRGTSTIYGDNDYAFIARINGNGPAAIPSSFDDTLQDPVFLITLQNAYDGIGSGGGRKIEVIDGAVRFRVPSAGAGDLNQTAFEIDAIDNENDGEIAQSIFAGGSGLGARKNAGFVHFCPMSHTTVLQKEEPVSFSGGGVIAVLTRGGVNLTTAKVLSNYEFALVKGSTNYNGLYRVTSTPATNMIGLQYLDGSSPSFIGPDTGTVTLLRPLLFSGDHSYWSRFHNVHMHGSNEETALAVLTVYPHENAQSIAVKAQSTASAVLFQRDGSVDFLYDVSIAAAAELQLANGAEMVLQGSSARIHDLTDSLMEINDAHGKWFGTGDGTTQIDAQGVKFTADASRGKGFRADAASHTAPPNFPETTLFDSFPSLGEKRDWNGNVFERTTIDGRVVRPQIFRADFQGHALQFGGIGSQDMDERFEHWQGSAGGGTIDINKGNSNRVYPGGVCVLETGVTVNNFIALDGAKCFGLNNTWGGVYDTHNFGGDLIVTGRFSIDSITGARYWAGIGGFGSTPASGKPIVNIGADVAETFQNFIGFRWDVAGYWRFQVLDNNTVRHDIICTGSSMTDGEWIDFFLYIPRSPSGKTVYYWITNMTAGLGSVTCGTVGGPQNVGARFEVGSTTATNKRMFVNYIEIRNTEPLLITDH